MIYLLKSRVELLEQILWLHSIDIESSIAELRSRRSISPDEQGLDIDAHSISTESSTQLEETLSLNGSLSFECDGETRYFGTSSGRVELLQYSNSESNIEQRIIPMLSGISKVDQFEFHPLDSLPSAVPLDPYMASSLSRGSRLIDIGEDISPELVDHLLELYFQWEQPWNQVVDETLFRQSQKDNGRFFSTLLLNCILAIGSRYSERIDLRTDPNDPNTAGQIFLENAEVMLHFDLRSPSIVTVQSLSVMAIAYVVSNISHTSLAVT